MRFIYKAGEASGRPGEDARPPDRRRRRHGRRMGQQSTGGGRNRRCENQRKSPSFVLFLFETLFNAQNNEASSFYQDRLGTANMIGRRWKTEVVLFCSVLFCFLGAFLQPRGTRTGSSCSPRPATTSITPSRCAAAAAAGHPSSFLR
jgi:hypothetical protein